MTFREEQEITYKERISKICALLPCFISEYVASNVLSKQPSTLYQYCQDFSIFFNYLSDNIDLFTKKEPKNYVLDDLKLIDHDIMNSFILGYSIGRSKTTVQRMIAALSSLFNYYVRLQKLEYNPTLSIEKPKPQKKEINRLKNEEKERFLKEVKTGKDLTGRTKVFYKKNNLRDYCIIRILLYTGIRVSELAGLNINDIDFKEHCIMITRKGNKIESVFLDDETENILSDYVLERKNKNIIGENALFLSNRNTRLSIRQIQVMVKKYAAYSIPDHKGTVSPHRLRATFGTDFYEKSGGDLLLTAEKLGHENIQTTKIYAEATKERQKNSRNILK